MTRWVRANLERGTFEGRRILDDASYDVLWTPSAEMGRSEVGLSWFLEELGGVPTISHGGADTGFTSYVVLMPEQNAGLVLAANYDRTPMLMLRDAMIEILQGEEPDRPRRPVGNDFAKIYYGEGLESAVAFYRRAEEEQADDYYFSDQQLNVVGYVLLGQGNVDGAIDVFTFNVELYPETGNCYDSLGEAFLARGDEELAIVNYRRAIELDPENTNAVEILGDLGAR
jgi:tetratricopeptide (TPR) repeat protein